MRIGIGIGLRIGIGIEILTEAIDARLSRPADHWLMFAAQDTIAVVYSAGIAVITTSRFVDTVAIPGTIVDCADFAVITNFRDILAPRDWIAGIDGAGSFVVTVFRCMLTSGSIVRVRGASVVIVTACQDVNAISFIAVIESGGIVVAAILQSVYTCLPIEGIDGTRIVIIAPGTMPGQNSLIHGLGCAVIPTINNDGPHNDWLIETSSAFTGIDSAVICIIAIPGQVNAGCAVEAIYGAGVAIITDYLSRYVLFVVLRFIAGNTFFNVTDIDIRKIRFFGFDALAFPLSLLKGAFGQPQEP